MRTLSSVGRLVSVFVLSLGVVFGVTLVKQDQDLRRSADEIKEHKQNICHKTGSESNTWVQIEVSKNALESHLEHGDIQGSCPEESKDKDNGNGNDSENEENRGGSSDSGSVTINNVTVNNSEIAPATVEYIYVTTGFEFYIKFQGIDEKKENKSVRVIFRKGDEELHVFNKVIVTANIKGIYRGTITDVRPGSYEVLVKGEGYLQRSFSINLVRGRNRFDWSDKELIAGDFDGNNILNAKDVAEFESFIVEEINPVQDETKVFDVNMDGQLDNKDLDIVISNFDKLEIKGDE